MREILYRGKPVTDTYDEYAGEYLFRESSFVHGSLVFYGKRPIIVGEVVETDPEYVNLAWWVMVKPETVGQYTGLNDREDVKIFEGDIVRNVHTGAFKRIAFSHKSGYVMVDEKNFICHSEFWGEYKVIGNIHDNPELLEVE